MTKSAMICHPVFLMTEARTYRRISVNHDETQALFDEGLRFFHAYNWVEARRLFGLAAAAEPQCAMAHWGVAMSETLDRNFAGESSAITRALLASQVSERDSNLIRAAAHAFGEAPAATLRLSYARAMRRYVRMFPEDLDGAFLSCFATFQWCAPPIDPPDFSSPEAAHLLPDLDAILRRNPDHEGANFLRIQTLEYLGRFSEGEENASSLLLTAKSVGLGHLIHRAAHVLGRIGRLDLSIETNLRGIDNNAQFIAGNDHAQTGPMRGHNSHVVETVVQQLSIVGQFKRAERTADSPALRSMVALRQHKWDAVARLGPVLYFAYAIALARLGRERELGPIISMLNEDGRRRDTTLVIQLALIRAAIAQAAGDAEAELRSYATAHDLERYYPFDPPIFWAYPAIEGYGAALLRAGRFADAERVFRDALTQAPYHPHYLVGHELARLHQGKPVDSRWREAPLVGSRADELDLALLA